jgi:hypothetical protein
MGSMTLKTIMCHTTKLKQAAMPCQATHAMQSYPFEPSKFDEQKNTKYQKITSLNNNNKKKTFPCIYIQADADMFEFCLGLHLKEDYSFVMRRR